jgi:20S proteasome alpha/beta subunit
MAIFHSRGLRRESYAFSLLRAAARPLKHWIYCAPRQKTRPLPRQNMTIALGFVCQNGVILAADSEVAYEGTKTPGQKIFLIDGGTYWSIAVAAAGGVDLIRMAVDDLKHTLQTDRDLTLEKIRQKIIERIKYFRDDYIWPAAERGIELALDLLIAVRTIDGRSALLKVNGIEGGLVSEVSGCEFIGIGHEIARSVSSWLFGLGFKLEMGERLAEQVIRWVKATVPGCGGSTQIWVLPNMGTGLRTGVWQDFEEGFFHHANSFLREIFWDCLNATASDAQFEENLRRFVERMRDFRRLNLEETEKNARIFSPIEPEPQPSQSSPEPQE